MEWISGHEPRGWADYSALEEHEAASAHGAAPHWAGIGQKGADTGRLSPSRDADIGVQHFVHSFFLWLRVLVSLAVDF